MKTGWRWDMLASAIHSQESAVSPRAQEARLELTRAGSEGYVRPCELNPAGWDVVSGSPSAERSADSDESCTLVKRETYDDALQRVVAAVDRCMECEVFVPCRRLADAVLSERRPSVIGVIGGILVDDTVTGRAISEAIGQGSNIEPTERTSA